MKRSQICRRNATRSSFVSPLSIAKKTCVSLSASTACAVTYAGSPAPIPMTWIRRVTPASMPDQAIRQVPGTAGIDFVGPGHLPSTHTLNEGTSTVTSSVKPQAGPTREEFAERLLKGSVKKSYAPVVDIDWDAPPDPDKFFLPPKT